VVVPLRSEVRAATSHESRPGLLELGPISPELALVDPELARAARDLLPDLPRARPVVSNVAAAPVADQSAFVARLRSGLEPLPDLAPRRRRLRLAWVASAAGLVSLGVLLTLAVGRETRPTPAPQTQGVAAAVSPTESARPEPTPVEPARAAPAAGAKATSRGASAATTPATSGTATGKPAAPASGHDLPVPGQTFVWVAVPDASAYEFQLFRRGERIFRARVDEPRLELPGRWRQAGRPYALVPDDYRWYVWPVSKRTNRQADAATVQARLVIEDQP
jgi:hypothetical protein